jgi:hypothetical protein
MPGMLRLNLSIAASDLALQPGDQGWAGALAVVYDERPADGKDLGRISETLNMRYDQDQYQKLATGGVNYQKLVRPSPQAAQIHIVVYDRGSGSLGSVSVKLQPALAQPS